jgi:hypothetical protein
MLDSSIEETKKKLEALLKEKAEPDAKKITEHKNNVVVEQAKKSQEGLTEDKPDNTALSVEVPLDEEAKKKERIRLKEEEDTRIKKEKVALIKNQLTPELVTRE